MSRHQAINIMDVHTFAQAANEDKTSLYAAAAREGDVHVLRFLSARYDDPAFKRRVFKSALSEQKYEVIQYMLDHHPGEGVQDDEEVTEIIDRATQDGDMNIIRLLVSRFAPTQKRNMFWLASAYRRIEVIRYMLDNHPGEGFKDDRDLYRAFDVAAENGDMQMVQLLAAAFPGVARSCDALRVAVSENHTELMKWMITNDIGVDKSNVFGYAQDISTLKWLREQFSDASITRHDVRQIVEEHKHDILTALTSEFPDGLPIDVPVTLAEYPPHLHEWLSKSIALTIGECPVCLGTKQVMNGYMCGHKLCMDCYRGMHNCYMQKTMDMVNHYYNGPDKETYGDRKVLACPQCRGPWTMCRI